MGRHCYLLQTHREPKQIWRLAARLRADSPKAAILITHDPSTCTLDAEAYRRDLDVTVTDALTPVVRGEFSMVDAYFHGVDALAARGYEYDWLTLLSGQDYPLRPVAMYEQFIDTQSFDAYLQYGDVLGPDSPWAPRRSQGKLRYFYHYRRLRPESMRWLRVLRRLNGMQKLVHVHTTLGPYVGIRTSDHPFRNGYRCYGGSAWHTLSRRCVEYLRERRRTETQLVDHFAQTMSPEEAFMHTVLVNSGRFRIHRGNLRHIDFKGSIGGSPRTLTSADLAFLLQSECYFARKFDVNVDAAVLDELDAAAHSIVHARTTSDPTQAAPIHSSRDSAT